MMVHFMSHRGNASSRHDAIEPPPSSDQLPPETEDDDDDDLYRDMPCTD